MSDDIKRFVESMEGRIDDSIAQNSSDLGIHIVCCNGHPWKTTSERVREWCPKCPKTISEIAADVPIVENTSDAPVVPIVEIATDALNQIRDEINGFLMRALLWIAKKSGTVTTEAYSDEKGVLRIGVKCAKGHEWPPRVANLAYDHSWCPTCVGNAPLTIEMMRALAVERGGRCLSTIYKGNKQPLDWECALGHPWKATPGNVKNHGSWCPRCVFNVGEEIVRATLEEAFPGHKFDRTRGVPWMEKLELDAYNEELKLAAEYQGAQHYERVEHFQRNEGDFEAQLDRDALTAQRCEKAGVDLLVVPHFVGYKNLRVHVRNELLKLGRIISPTVGSDTEFYYKGLAPLTNPFLSKTMLCRSTGCNPRGVLGGCCRQPLNL